MEKYRMLAEIKMTLSFQETVSINMVENNVFNRKCRIEACCNEYVFSG